MTRRRKKPAAAPAPRSTGGTGTVKAAAALGQTDFAADPGGSAVVAGNLTAAVSPTVSLARFRAVRFALVALAFAGFLVSFYLTLTHYRHLIPPCYGTTGCETVITSRYSTLLGIPLSLIGAVFFASMFYLGIALLTVSRPIVLRAYELLAYAGLLAAVCLFLLQALVLHAYCTYCLTTEVIALLMWGGSFLLTSSAKRSGKGDSDPVGESSRAGTRLT